MLNQFDVLYDNLDGDSELLKDISKSKFKEHMKKKDIRKLMSICETILNTNNIREANDIRKLKDNNICSIIFFQFILAINCRAGHSEEFLQKAKYLIKELNDPVFFNFVANVFKITDFTKTNQTSGTERFTETIKT